MYCLNSQQELTEIKLNMRACIMKSVESESENIDLVKIFA